MISVYRQLIRTVLACTLSCSLLVAQPLAKQSAMNSKLVKPSLATPLIKTAGVKAVPLSDIVVTKLPAKAFVASTLRNPETGRPTPGDTILTFETKNNGKKNTVRMKASEYYEKLNATERGYNDIGYSVYDASGDRPVALQTMKLSPNVLSTQVTKAPANVSARLPSSATKTSFGMKSNVLKNSTPMVLESRAVKPGLFPKNFSHDESKRWEFGERSSFQAYMEVRCKSDGAIYTSAAGSLAPENRCHFHAKGIAGGAILNHDFEIVKAFADFDVPSNGGDITTKATVNILGDPTTLIDERVKTAWSMEDQFKTSVGVEVPFVVPLGPISIKGAVGVNGNAGVRYDVSVSRSGFTGTVTPFVEVNGYGEAGVDILIAGGGVGANITLAKAEVDLSSTALLAWRGGKLHLTDELTMSYEVNFLSGRIYAYAYVMVPAFKMPPWKEKRFEHNFFSWDGYKKSGTLFSTTNDIVID